MMKLSKRLENIEYDGYIEKVLMKLKRARHIVIFGAGDRARFLAEFLLKKGIEFEAFWINRQYFSEGLTVRFHNQDKPVRCYEEEINRRSEITIVLGIAQSIIDIHMFDREGILEIIPINVGVRDDYLMEHEFYASRANELDWLYDRLADDDSREYLYAHLYGRLTGRDILFQPSGWTDPQYIFDEFMRWNEKECYIDCGAYTGDSIEEFIEKMPPQMKKFTVYALEPDRNNYKMLQEKYGGTLQIKCLCLGAYSKKGTVLFENSNGEASAVSNVGNVMIEVDTIDHILKEEAATFIKMDIEGSELEALKGAEKQITENTPRLAVCVYHKKEDLCTIPQMIMGWNSRYKLFLRPHSSMPTELVLFCIPEDQNDIA